MTIRTVLIAAASVASLGCSARHIPGTDLTSTPDSRAVYDVVREYQQAMEKKDAEAVLSLVAPDYFDNAGTPDPADDLDRARLAETLAQDLSRAEGLKLELTVRKILIEGDQAQVEVFYDSFYRVQTPARAVPRRDSDIHRMKLRKIDGAWKISSGL